MARRNPSNPRGPDSVGKRRGGTHTSSVLKDSLVLHKGHISLLNKTPEQVQIGGRKTGGQIDTCHSEAAYRTEVGHLTPARVRTILSLNSMHNEESKSLQVAMQFHKLSSTHCILFFLFFVSGVGRVYAHSCGCVKPVHMYTYVQNLEVSVGHLP